MATPRKRSTAPKKSGGSSADRPAPASSRRKVVASPVAPTPDAIAARAYEIYLERGGGHGADEDDWFSAERELSSVS